MAHIETGCLRSSQAVLLSPSKMLHNFRTVLYAASLASVASAANTTLLQDPIGAVPPVTQGQALEIAHLYYSGYPTAIAVDGASGRQFCKLYAIPFACLSLVINAPRSCLSAALPVFTFELHCRRAHV